MANQIHSRFKCCIRRVVLCTSFFSFVSLAFSFPFLFSSIFFCIYVRFFCCCLCPIHVRTHDRNLKQKNFMWFFLFLVPKATVAVNICVNSIICLYTILFRYYYRKEAIARNTNIFNNLACGWCGLFFLLLLCLFTSSICRYRLPFESIKIKAHTHQKIQTTKLLLVIICSVCLWLEV